jgi:hypothetical protein
VPELVGENPKPCLSIPRCFRSCIRGRSGSSPRVWSEQRSSDTVFSASTGQAASLVCDQPGAHLLRAYAHQHHRDALSRRVASRSNTPARTHTPESAASSIARRSTYVWQPLQVQGASKSELCCGAVYANSQGKAREAFLCYSRAHRQASRKTRHSIGGSAASNVAIPQLSSRT